MRGVLGPAGRFLYGVGHVGWIGPDQWPVTASAARSPAQRLTVLAGDQARVADGLLAPELEQARLLFEDLPLLSTYFLIRFDFGASPARPPADGLGWAGLGWDGVGWAGLGWAGLGWAGLGWAGLG